MEEKKSSRESRFKALQLILVFVFGAVFLGVLLLLSVVFPNPTKFTYEVCKVILAIATACIATLLSG
ncbi:MAG: hypothetical protein P8M79_02475, partial [Alphaproteobacteria bacterium]|nr:hypothetical protein [Alphaproteobacteria bacterium]